MRPFEEPEHAMDQLLRQAQRHDIRAQKALLRQVPLEFLHGPGVGRIARFEERQRSPKRIVLVEQGLRLLAELRAAYAKVFELTDGNAPVRSRITRVRLLPCFECGVTDADDEWLVIKSTSAVDRLLQRLSEGANLSFQVF